MKSRVISGCPAFCFLAHEIISSDQKKLFIFALYDIDLMHFIQTRKEITND